MLRRAIMTLAILVMLPSAASASSFTFYGTHLGFAQGPDEMVFGGQLQWNGVAPRMAFVPGLDYTFSDRTSNSFMTLNTDLHYNLTYETSWQPYFGAGVGVNVWSDGVRRRGEDTGPGAHMIVGVATRNHSGGRFFTEMKLGFGDSPAMMMLAGWNLRSH